MPYLPGPLTLQNPADVGIETAVYDFVGYSLGQLGELETTPAAWDAFLQDAGVLLDEPSDPIPGIDLNAAIDTVGGYSDPGAALGVNALSDALGTSDVALSYAIGYAPPEAWVDTSAQFIPPATAETLNAPFINPGIVATEVTGSPTGVPSGVGTGIPDLGATLTLTNLTAFGNANFTVGDQFRVRATGRPGQRVFASSTLNGADQGEALLGTIGGDGTFVINGVMTPDTVGVWSEDWYIEITKVATFNFIVLDA